MTCTAAPRCTDSSRELKEARQHKMTSKKNKFALTSGFFSLKLIINAIEVFCNERKSIKIDKSMYLKIKSKV